jgi:hypothetical protein
VSSFMHWMRLPNVLVFTVKFWGCCAQFAFAPLRVRTLVTKNLFNQGEKIR